jgi:hypothetical protein
MTEICERHPLRCPFPAAAEYLGDALSDASPDDTLRLVAPVGAACGGLAKDVHVKYTRVFAPPDHTWNVEWKPEPGGIYPAFEGRITIFAAEQDGGAVLELAGRYTPPGGALGQVFDSLIGARIASATLQELVTRLGAAIDRRCAECRHPA